MVQLVVQLVVTKVKNVFKDVMKETAWNSKLVTMNGKAKKNVQKVTLPFKHLRTMWTSEMIAKLLQTFWEGKKECPEGYSPIQAFENDVDVRNDCKAAADFLGKDFYDDFDKAPEGGDPWVCTLCGGCPQDEKPIKFGKNGDMAKWVCKKDAEASA